MDAIDIIEVVRVNTQNQIPQDLISFINKKLGKNEQGGRPNFLQVLATDRDVQNEVLKIPELAWLQNRSIGNIARKFNTSYHTIYRLLKDIEPFREQLIHFLKTNPRRNVFWNRDLNTSDYQTVTAYIKHAKREELKNFKNMLCYAMKVWRALGHKDPSKWNIDGVIDFIRKKSDGSQSNYVDAVRCVAPQLKETLKTGNYREKIKRRKKDIFGNEVKLIHECLDSKGMHYHNDVFDFHITGGFREGSNNTQSGICGISWDRFRKNFHFVDDYESKVRKRGIWWRNCPVDLFFRDLPARLRSLWIARGKPITDEVVLDGYKGLTKVYTEIREALKEYWKGKLEPDIYEQLITLKPHDADKIHCNLLWEAEVPLEVVAGQHIGGQEGVGLVGRGWTSIDTIKKYYLSLTQRSKRYQKMLQIVREYSAQFNGGAHK